MLRKLCEKNSVRNNRKNACKSVCLFSLNYDQISTEFSPSFHACFHKFSHMFPAGFHTQFEINVFVMCMCWFCWRCCCVVRHAPKGGRPLRCIAVYRSKVLRSNPCIIYFHPDAAIVGEFGAQLGTEVSSLSVSRSTPCRDTLNCEQLASQNGKMASKVVCLFRRPQSVSTLRPLTVLDKLSYNKRKRHSHSKAPKGTKNNTTSLHKTGLNCKGATIA